MRKVPGKDSKPELIIRKFLFANGIRFRNNDKRFPGKPDIFILKYHIAIFYHGCFWHGHIHCKHSRLPKSNNEYWQTKILRNIDRDKLVLEKLLEIGINAIVIWGCEIDTIAKRSQKLTWLLERIHQSGVEP